MSFYINDFRTSYIKDDPITVAIKELSSPDLRYKSFRDFGPLITLIVNCARRRAIGVSSFDLDDLVQETLIRLIRNPPNMQEIKSPNSYIHAIVRNLTHSIIRRDQRYRELTETSLTRSGTLWALEEFQDETAGPEAVAVANEIRESVWRALATLPESERVALVGTELEGMTTAEAAEKLGVSRFTVRRYIRRGRERLVTLLGGEVGDTGSVLFRAWDRRLKVGANG